MQDKVKPWNDRYSSGEFYYGIEPNDFLKSQVSKIKPGGKVLCLAEVKEEMPFRIQTLVLI